MSSNSDEAALPEDFEVQLLRYLVKNLLDTIKDPERAAEMPVAEKRLILDLLKENSIDFNAVKKGDFGETAKRAAEEFPFDAQSGTVQKETMQ